MAKSLDHILTSYIDSKDTNTLRKAFRAHHGFYGQKRINVSHVYSDNEKGISALAPQFAGAGITLTHCAPGAHVHIVERAIRYVKEGARCILAGLPYQSPKSLLRYLVPFAAARVNLFPTSTLSDNLSAYQLLYNRPADDTKDCHLAFGALYHVIARQTVLWHLGHIPPLVSHKYLMADVSIYHSSQWGSHNRQPL